MEHLSSIPWLWLIIYFALAGLDGTIHLWSTSGTYARPSSTVEGAHMKGAETGSLVFSHDGHTLVSRGGDGTVKRECEPFYLQSICLAITREPMGTQVSMRGGAPGRYVGLGELCTDRNRLLCFQLSWLAHWGILTKKLCPWPPGARSCGTVHRLRLDNNALIGSAWIPTSLLYSITANFDNALFWAVQFGMLALSRSRWLPPQCHCRHFILRLTRFSVRMSDTSLAAAQLRAEEIAAHS